jgi:beta-1,2-mannosidase
MTVLRASRFVLPALGISLLLLFLVPEHIQQAFVSAAVPGVSYVTFSDWQRVSEMPTLSPRGSGWEAAGTFNPTVLSSAEILDDRWVGRTEKAKDYTMDGYYVMLYRAQDANGISRIGHAIASDANFTYPKLRRDEPVLSPEAEYEKDGGIEDPRLLKIGGTFYLTYTGYNKKDAQLCLATSRDLIHWERKGIIVPANRGNWNVKWTKSGAIVPQKINGKYWMYWLGTAADQTDQMGLSSSTDLLHWTEETATPVLPRRAGRFDSRVVEPGPPPILLRDRIVLVYNGADDHLVYRTGVANFDVRDPRKLLWRTDEPIFQPEKDWEKTGQVPNVVFVEGMTRTSTTIIKPDEEFLFYYGAADKYVGVARAKLRIRSLAMPN